MARHRQARCGPTPRSAPRSHWNIDLQPRLSKHENWRRISRAARRAPFSVRIRRHANARPVPLDPNGLPVRCHIAALAASSADVRKLGRSPSDLLVIDTGDMDVRQGVRVAGVRKSWCIDAGFHAAGCARSAMRGWLRLPDGETG